MFPFLQVVFFAKSAISSSHKQLWYVMITKKLQKFAFALHYLGACNYSYLVVSN